MRLCKHHIMKHISAFYDPKEKWHKKFAWFPKRSSHSGGLIWLKPYWQVEIYMDGWGKVPIEGLAWQRILTESEMLITQLKHHK